MIYIVALFIGLAVLGVVLIITAEWRGEVLMFPSNRFFVGGFILVLDLGMLIGAMLYGLIN